MVCVEYLGKWDDWGESERMALRIGSRRGGGGTYICCSRRRNISFNDWCQGRRYVHLDTTSRVPWGVVGTHLAEKGSRLGQVTRSSCRIPDRYDPVEPETTTGKRRKL